MLRRVVLAVIVAALAVPAVAFAEKVDLRDGTRLEGKITGRSATSVEIQMPDGARITIPAEHIAAIDGTKYRPDWQAVYKSKLAQADTKDAAVLLELAKWCGTVGLAAETAETFRLVLAADPENTAAHKALGHEMYEGKWVDPEEMRAKGLVLHGGKWMTEDEAMRAKGFVKYQGKWVPEDEAMKAQGLVKYDGKWMTEDQVKQAKGMVKLDGKWVSKDEVKDIELQGYRKYRDQWNTNNVACLRDEINLLNLLNALYLTDEQMVMLVVIGKNAENLRKKYQQDVEKVNQDMERVFGELRDELINGVNRGFDTPTGVLSKAGMTEGRIKGLEEKLNHELVAYEQEIRKVLNTNQIEIIDAYKSCLIPPKELSDPTRIGQANPAGTYYEKLLEQMRGISDDELDRNKEKLLAGHLERVEHHIKSPLSAEERIAETRRVMEIVKRTRAMNDADFACSRVDLAAEMEYQKKSEMLKQQIQNLQRELSRSGEKEGERAKLGALTKVGGFLLNPKLPELLFARLKKSKTFVKAPLVDLGELEAGTCETESSTTPEKK